MTRTEPTLAELEKALRINEHELETECRDQAVMFYHVALEGTLATSRRDDAKKELADIEAELDAQIRRSAEVSGDKITEGAIKAEIRLDKKYQRAATELAKLNKEVGKLAALRESYDHRKEMLKLMVRLYLANYFGEIEEKGISNELRNGTANYARKVLANRYEEKERKEAQRVRK